MPEISIPVQPDPFPSIPIERAPNSIELERWRRLLIEHDKAWDAMDRAGLLLSNIYIAWSFGAKHGLVMPSIDPAVEKSYFEARQQFDSHTAAIRQVQDHTAGIRLSGNDLDIVVPQPEGMSGLVIPVIIGALVVAAAGAIAAAIWQTKAAQQYAAEYTRLLTAAEKQFCADPSSPTCSAWKIEKKSTPYEKNMTLADHLKSGLKTAASGLVVGILIIVGLGIAIRRL